MIGASTGHSLRLISIPPHPELGEAEEASVQRQLVMAEKYPPDEPDPPDEQAAQVHLVVTLNPFAPLGEEEWAVGTGHSLVLHHLSLPGQDRFLAEVELA